MEAQKPEQRLFFPRRHAHTFSDLERRRRLAQRSEQCCTHLQLGHKLPRVPGSQQFPQSDEETRELFDSWEQQGSQDSPDTTGLVAVPEPVAKAELNPVTESRQVGRRPGSDSS